MFEGKNVLVTGAVRNTGLAIAEAFAAEKATLVLNGRKEADVAREAARLRETYGITVIEATADISIPEQVDAMFNTIRSKVGHLDALVNNAIIQGCGYAFTETPLDVLEQVFRVNVFGTYHCAQGAARLMQGRGGSIVNIGSNVVDRAIRERTAYIASKGAIDALTRAMAVELGPEGIRVNTVVAGYIHSDRWEVLPEKETKRRRLNIPLGQEATGSDIADAALFFASDRSSKVNGARLVVDGGMSSQLVPIDCDM